MSAKLWANFATWLYAPCTYSTWALLQTLYAVQSLRGRRGRTYRRTIGRVRVALEAAS